MFLSQNQQFLCHGIHTDYLRLLYRRIAQSLTLRFKQLKGPDFPLNKIIKK